MSPRSVKQKAMLASLSLRAVCSDDLIVLRSSRTRAPKEPEKRKSTPLQPMLCLRATPKIPIPLRKSSKLERLLPSKETCQPPYKEQVMTFALDSVSDTCRCFILRFHRAQRMLSTGLPRPIPIHNISMIYSESNARKASRASG
jgi:hypothetical protein